LFTRILNDKSISKKSRELYELKIILILGGEDYL
jgi:hypothetical protein